MDTVTRDKIICKMQGTGEEYLILDDTADRASIMSKGYFERITEKGTVYRFVHHKCGMARERKFRTRMPTESLSYKTHIIMEGTKLPTQLRAVLHLKEIQWNNLSASSRHNVEELVQKHRADVAYQIWCLVSRVSGKELQQYKYLFSWLGPIVEEELASLLEKPTKAKGKCQFHSLNKTHKLALAMLSPRFNEEYYIGLMVKSKLLS